MKKSIRNLLCLWLCLAALLLAACTATTGASPSATAEPTQAPTAAPTAAAEPTPEPAAEVDLKDDFYEAVNAQWLAQATIPAGMPAVGGFQDLATGVEEALMADFAAMLEGTAEPGNEEMANFIEYYRLATDFAARDAAGAEPLLPYLAMIEELETLEDLTGRLAEWDLQGMPLPFTMGVIADMGNAALNALYIQPASLFLMDRSYYEDEATHQMLRSASVQMAANLLALTGKSPEEAAAIAERAMVFDESLAPHTASAAESSDYTTIYNPVPLAELDAQAENIDLTAMLNELLGTVPETVIVTHPPFFAALDDLMNEDTFEAMKSWMMVRVVADFSAFLSEDFRVEGGSVSRMMTGMTEAPNRETATYNLVAGTFSDVVGVYYGQTYFGDEAKADVAAMVDSFIAIFEERLDANTWLGAETLAQAKKKLETMSVHVGYPDAADPLYSEFVTVTAEDGGTFVDNAITFTRVAKEDNYADWNQPVDRDHWSFSANTVNAAYSPMNNSITFPAAILQAPFYSLEQSASANLGGIGAVIAHEISHAFDPNGSKMDELGNLNNWWTEEDYAAFAERSQAMVAEFDGIEFAGGQVNGQLTLAENVADLGGLACALQAAKQLEEVDLTAFFTNWAVIWRQKATPEVELMLLTMDVHGPNKLRANIQLQNMDDFFTTFTIVEGDGMYRAPEDRVAIW